VKGFISHLHRIQLEDYLMSELSKSGEITFSKLVSREKHRKVPKSNIKKIKSKKSGEVIDDRIKYAIQKASQVRTKVEKLQSEQFLKPVQLDIKTETIVEFSAKDLEDEVFLRTDFDEFQSQYLYDDDLLADQNMYFR
jgi:hypothetical protein